MGNRIVFAGKLIVAKIPGSMRIIIIRATPSLSTKECIALPRPGSWDLGTPRMVNILTSATPPLMGERPRAHYRFLEEPVVAT